MKLLPLRYLLHMGTEDIWVAQAGFSLFLEESKLECQEEWKEWHFGGARSPEVHQKPSMQ